MKQETLELLKRILEISWPVQPMSDSRGYYFTLSADDRDLILGATDQAIALLESQPKCELCGGSGKVKANRKVKMNNTKVKVRFLNIKYFLEQAKEHDFIELKHGYIDRAAVEIENLCKALTSLESQPEPTKFAKKLKKVINYEKGWQENYDADAWRKDNLLILEQAYDIINRQAAEYKQLEATITSRALNYRKGKIKEQAEEIKQLGGKKEEYSLLLKDMHAQAHKHISKIKELEAKIDLALLELAHIEGEKTWTEIGIEQALKGKSK